MEAAGKTGNTLGNTATGFYGSTGAFNRQISQPAISSDKPMSTISGATFNGQIACPSSSKFMEVTGIPTSTGDIAVTVKQQTDFSLAPGTFDYAYTLPDKVSGVCANGFIACDPGTWNSCRYYAWATLPGSVALTAKSTGINALGGCFCVNSSCGYTLAAVNYSYVLGFLGGGMSAAVQATAPELAVSMSDVVPPTASFYGQQSGGCASLIGPAGSSATPQKYWSGSGNMSATFSADSSNAMLSNPYYADLEALQMATTGKYSTNMCDITRSWTVATETRSLSKTGSGSICVVSDISAGVIKTADADSYEVRIGATTFAGYPGCPASSPITVDTVDLAAMSLSLPTGAVSPAIFKGVSGNAHFTAGGCSQPPTLISAADAMVAISGCTMIGFHNGVYDYSLTFEYMFDASSDTLTDACTPYMNDPNCTLKDEYEYDAQDNGVRSYRDYQPTGLHVLATSSTRTTSIGAYSKTYNWWKISRTYLCRGGNSLDLAKMKKRVGIVNESTASYKGGVNQEYSDYQCDDNGNCTNSTGSINADPSLANSAPAQCENACKVRVDAPATNASASGNQSQYSTSSTGPIHLFRACVDGGTVCPADASKGETPVARSDGKICYCTEEFTSSATALAGLMAAGHNLMCSSNHKCPAGQKWDTASGTCKP